MPNVFPTVYPINRHSAALNKGAAFTGGSAGAQRYAAQNRIYAGRLFSRRAVDVRARITARSQVDGRMVEAVVHGRTVDLSRSGAGMTLFRELPRGAEVVLSLQLPNSSGPLSLPAIVVRRRGFRAGLIFVQLTAEQRLLLCEFCHA